MNTAGPLTHNHANFTSVILIIAGDHRCYCVIDHCNYIHLKILQWVEKKQTVAFLEGHMKK